MTAGRVTPQVLVAVTGIHLLTASILPRLRFAAVILGLLPPAPPARAAGDLSESNDAAASDDFRPPPPAGDAGGGEAAAEAESGDGAERAACGCTAAAADAGGDAWASPAPPSPGSAVSWHRRPAGGGCFGASRYDASPCTPLSARSAPGGVNGGASCAGASGVGCRSPAGGSEASTPRWDPGAAAAPLQVPRLCLGGLRGDREAVPAAAWEGDSSAAGGAGAAAAAAAADHMAAAGAGGGVMGVMGLDREDGLRQCLEEFLAEQVPPH